MDRNSPAASFAAWYPRGDMGFSDKMRETLGSEGARVEIVGNDGGWAAEVEPGGQAVTTFLLSGGTKAAKIDALILRVIVAHRQWGDKEGMTYTDHQAQELTDRSHLYPSWRRETVHETRVEIGDEIESSAKRELSIKVMIPDHCDRTALGCTIILHAQADIKGQIDPTAVGRLRVA